MRSYLGAIGLGAATRTACGRGAATATVLRPAVCVEEEMAPCTAELIWGWMEERIWAMRASWEAWLLLLLLETRALG